MSRHSFIIKAEDPCLDGHFPGDPIVPAVVILDAVIAFATQSRDREFVTIERCKFLRPLRPGQTCSIEISELVKGSLRFKCSTQDGQELVIGRLRLGEECDAG